MKNRTSDGGAGVRAAVPIMLGYVPVGIAYGVMARQAGMSVWQTVLMSLTVYGGASEMMAAGMVAQEAAVAAIVLTTFVLNLRHIMMSACVFERMEGGSRPARLLAAFGVTDESFAVYTTMPGAPRSPAFFGAMALSAYLSWAAGSWLGAVANDFLPPALTAALGISLYAMFIGLLLPGLRGNGWLAALVTYLPRALPALFMDRLSIGPQMRRFLGLIPYTAMTALVFPAVFAVGESACQGALGALTAGILAWKKCPVILCVVAAVAVEALLMMI